jgi:hypothetical protein
VFYDCSQMFWTKNIGSEFYISLQCLVVAQLSFFVLKRCDVVVILPVDVRKMCGTVFYCFHLWDTNTQS